MINQPMHYLLHRALPFEIAGLPLQPGVHPTVRLLQPLSRRHLVPPPWGKGAKNTEPNPVCLDLLFLCPLLLSLTASPPPKPPPDVPLYSEDEDDDDSADSYDEDLHDSQRWTPPSRKVQHNQMPMEYQIKYNRYREKQKKATEAVFAAQQKAAAEAKAQAELARLEAKAANLAAKVANKVAVAAQRSLKKRYPRLSARVRFVPKPKSTSSVPKRSSHQPESSGKWSKTSPHYYDGASSDSPSYCPSHRPAGFTFHSDDDASSSSSLGGTPRRDKSLSSIDYLRRQKAMLELSSSLAPNSGDLHTNSGPPVGGDGHECVGPLAQTTEAAVHPAT